MKGDEKGQDGRHLRRGHVLGDRQATMHVLAIGRSLELRQLISLLHLFYTVSSSWTFMVTNSLVVCHFLAITLIIIITGTLHNSSDHVGCIKDRSMTLTLHITR